jgi:hypothetical protein
MKLACWLMERFGIDQVVVGDLAEASTTHTRAWLWRQTLGVLATSLARDVAKQPFLAIRAVLLGLALRQMAIPFGGWVEHMFDQRIEQAVDLFDASLPTLVAVAALANSLLAAPMWFGLGWLVARFHRNHHALLVVAAMWAQTLPPFARQIAHASGDPRSHMALQLTTKGLWIGVLTVSVLAGALMNNEARRETA